MKEKLTWLLIGALLGALAYATIVPRKIKLKRINLFTSYNHERTIQL